jgi:glucose/arabinose dehydrogenase
MALTPDGTLFVGTRQTGNLYAIRDTNGDYQADEVMTLANGMNSPNGVAFKDGSLYVAEIDRILRYDNIEASLPDLPEPVVINDDYPTDGHHGWKFIRFGPDGRLYIPVGAPCNICEIEDTPYGKITSIAADGSDYQVYADGVRNSVGFDWNPETGVMWFTDNGRDNLGDNVPPDELNRAPEAGLNFGYPYCHAGTIIDPDFGEGRSCDEFTPPAQPLGPHVASLGLRFYTGDMFPEEYKNQIFIAEHGSWNRTEPIGYQVSLVRHHGEGNVTSYEPFAEGWLQSNGESLGRPVDIQQMPDGSILVSDDTANAIYRIWYEGE